MLGHRSTLFRQSYHGYDKLIISILLYVLFSFVLVYYLSKTGEGDHYDYKNQFSIHEILTHANY